MGISSLPLNGSININRINNKNVGEKKDIDKVKIKEDKLLAEKNKIIGANGIHDQNSWENMPDNRNNIKITWRGAFSPKVEV